MVICELIHLIFIFQCYTDVVELLRVNSNSQVKQQTDDPLLPERNAE